MTAARARPRATKLLISSRPVLPLSSSCAVSIRKVGAPEAQCLGLALIASCHPIPVAKLGRTLRD